MLQTQRAINTLYLKASGEKEQMGQHEKEMRYGRRQQRARCCQ